MQSISAKILSKIALVFACPPTVNTNSFDKCSRPNLPARMKAKNYESKYEQMDQSNVPHLKRHCLEMKTLTTK